MKILSRKEKIKIVESVVGKVPWSKFKAGIYNYCDRWCEKCKNTTKCYLFWEMEKENKELISKGLNPHNLKVIFQSVHKSLKQTGELIRKISEAEGIDLEMSENEEKEYEKYEKQTDISKEPLKLKTEKLFRSTLNWLRSFKLKDDYCFDELEKIQWYFSLVSAKTARALHGFKEYKYEKDKISAKFAKEDSIKTAWIAYRSAKICKKSLEKIYDYQSSNKILELIKDYQKISQQIDQKFLTEEICLK